MEAIAHRCGTDWRPGAVQRLYRECSLVREERQCRIVRGGLLLIIVWFIFDSQIPLIRSRQGFRFKKEDRIALTTRALLTPLSRYVPGRPFRCALCIIGCFTSRHFVDKRGRGRSRLLSRVRCFIVDGCACKYVLLLVRYTL